MPNAFALQGASMDQSHFAPLMQNRIFTGIWTNRSALRDAATTFIEERYYGGRQDSIIGGLNTEISSRLTLRRRPGTTIYNSQIFPQVNRFYSFNTFTTTDENIRVMLDTAGTVYDGTGPNTQNAIWQKSAGAGPTYFLGVGNILYFTNGVDNKKWNFTTNQVSNWSLAAPINAPVASQGPRPAAPPSWSINTVYEEHLPARSGITIVDMYGGGFIHTFYGNGQTGQGPNQPTFNNNIGGQTPDGTVTWTNLGPNYWQPSHNYALGDICMGMAFPEDAEFFFMATTGGVSAGVQPTWPANPGLQRQDNQVVWTNIGHAIAWQDIGPNELITSTAQILDSNGYLQNVVLSGKSGSIEPTWQTPLGSQTTDNTMVWANAGPWAVATTGIVQWGYAFKNSQTGDISNMSPATLPFTILQNNAVTLQGDGSADPQVDTIVIYRIAQGGSTFVYLTEIPAPAAGQKWTYVDTSPDAALNPEIQAAVNGENTPLPAGASCLAYHLQRIFAAVGNVVYFSTGPEATVNGGNGNSGFRPVNSFTCQSKITRLWPNAVGLVVFTVRDAYIILLDSSSGTATAASLYMTLYIEGLPLLSYDAFTVNKTIAYVMTAQKMVLSLEASAGILEVSFPIADQIFLFNPASSYLTWHTETSGETALYVSDGKGAWFRMSATSAPETGLNWSPMAILNPPHLFEGTRDLGPGSACAVQSVEVTPGQNRLLIGPGPAGGPIAMRDRTVSTDTGTPYPAYTTFGSIVLAAPGQLAGLAFITLESSKTGTATALSVMLGEISGTFEHIRRTRQDPPNLPPSDSLYSDRFSLMQRQQPVWCRHFQMRLDWPAEDAANELLAFCIFGQTWQEYRSQ